MPINCTGAPVVKAVSVTLPLATALQSSSTVTSAGELERVGLDEYVSVLEALDVIDCDNVTLDDSDTDSLELDDAVSVPR